MLILRINNELVFAHELVTDSLEEKARSVGISDKEFDEALLQFVFHLENCDEAVEVFNDFSVCPVCGAEASKGIMVHKSHEEIVQ